MFFCYQLVDKDGNVKVQFFDDNVYFTTSVSNIKNGCSIQEGDIRKVKWDDGVYYKAKILKSSKTYSINVLLKQEGISN